jgi:predicted RNA-binding Zn ribbon-like protein
MLEMPVREPFLFLGGSPALDFVNTEVMADGRPKDLLGDGEDLVRWLERSGLAGEEDARSMRKAPPEAARKWIARARALRGSLRKTFRTLASGGSLGAADLRPLDEILARSRFRPRVAFARGRARLAFESVDPFSPLVAIASSAAEFFASANLAQVRQCEGTGCILFFYDVTKSHTRRWCRMNPCGNRIKAAAHYRRTRASSGTRGRS